MSDRYNGKPLLRLLECYVLDAVGHLEETQRAQLVAMQPKLSAVYRRTGTWSEILSQEMDFPPDFSLQIEALWRRNLDLAKARGVELTPQAFAEGFVDQNFS